MLLFSWLLFIWSKCINCLLCNLRIPGSSNPHKLKVQGQIWRKRIPNKYQLEPSPTCCDCGLRVAAVWRIMDRRPHSGGIHLGSSQLDLCHLPLCLTLITKEKTVCPTWTIPKVRLPAQWKACSLIFSCMSSKTPRSSIMNVSGNSKNEYIHLKEQIPLCVCVWKQSQTALICEIWQLQARKEGNILFCS